MANNESRMFRIPESISTEAVAGAVESFLAGSKGMETQSAQTTDGYVVQGSQDKDGWKTISGMRLAITVQIVRMGETMTVTVGEGQWSDKIGASAIGWFVAWPLLVTAGIGAYKQKKLPEEIFQEIDKFIVSGGRSTIIRNAGATVAAGMIVCPACKSQCREGSRFCDNCGSPLSRTCSQCGATLEIDSRFCPQCGGRV